MGKVDRNAFNIPGNPDGVKTFVLRFVADALGWEGSLMHLPTLNE